jgi:hypothetical protein
MDLPLAAAAFRRMSGVLTKCSSSVGTTFVVATAELLGPLSTIAKVMRLAWARTLNEAIPMRAAPKRTACELTNVWNMRTFPNSSGAGIGADTR